MCSGFAPLVRLRRDGGIAMVRRGSPVRVRQRALEAALQRGFSFRSGSRDYFQGIAEEVVRVELGERVLVHPVPARISECRPTDISGAARCRVPPGYRSVAVGPAAVLAGEPSGYRFVVGDPVLLTTNRSDGATAEAAVRLCDDSKEAGVAALERSFSMRLRYPPGQRVVSSARERRVATSA